LQGIASGIQAETVEHLDLTPPAAETCLWPELHDELVLMGAPVYGGSIPVEAARRLRRLTGHDTPAVVVAVYGNRAYENALLLLKELAAERGFRLVAGGAFIGEHSLSNDDTPIAKGRPDTEDLQKALAFGRMIQSKLTGLRALDQMPPLHVPGHPPYEEWNKRWGITPATQETLCTKCAGCARVCPTAAVTVGETVTTNQGACLICCACVKNCPTGARVLDHPRIRQSRQWLSAHCRERKEPEIYL